MLQKASQAVKVTWQTDDLDKENNEPLPAGGESVSHTPLTQLDAVSLMAALPSCIACLALCVKELCWG